MKQRFDLGKFLEQKSALKSQDEALCSVLPKQSLSKQIKCVISVDGYLVLQKSAVAQTFFLSCEEARQLKAFLVGIDF